MWESENGLTIRKGTLPPRALLVVSGSISTTVNGGEENLSTLEVKLLYGTVATWNVMTSGAGAGSSVFVSHAIQISTSSQ